MKKLALKIWGTEKTIRRYEHEGMFILIDGIYMVLCLVYTHLSNLRKAFLWVISLAFYMIQQSSVLLFGVSLSEYVKWTAFLR